MENAGDANLRALWPLVLENQESINTIIPHKRGSLEQIKHILQSDDLNNIESEVIAFNHVKKSFQNIAIMNVIF